MSTARSDSARVRILQNLGFEFQIAGRDRKGIQHLLHIQQLQPRPGRFERPEMGAQLGVGDQHVNARVVQDEVDLVRLEEVVDRHDHGAGVQNAEQRRDEFRAVLEPQPHAVAGLDAKLMAQHARHEQRLAPKFAVRIPAFAPIHGGFLRMLLHGIRKSAGQIHDEGTS